MQSCMKQLTKNVAREAVREGKRAGAILRGVKAKDKVLSEDSIQWPRKIFSGIQPTGALHLGNYLGAVKKWRDLQNDREDVTFCIVDMHSITMPQDPRVLRENIFQMAATMMACGIDPDRSTLFVQSAVKEHSELCWILSCLSTMARLGHLPQYKEKTRMLKEIPLGLFVYPVLQAADIMLYKSTHVPVGEDQIQHIQLTQHLARIFNAKYGNTFPICHAIIEDKTAARIRSLRDPKKKMSKSDTDPKATINITDEGHVIVEKFKKGMTDFTSDVHYMPDVRPGVSNLIAIHSLITGDSIEKIVSDAANMDTGRFKLIVAEAVVEHLTPLRIKIKQHLEKRDELMYLLEIGAEKARENAAQTMDDVRQKVGLGAMHIPMTMWDTKHEELTVIDVNQMRSKVANVIEAPEVPAVPKQKLRVEKKRMEIKVDIFKPKPEPNFPTVKPKLAEVKAEEKPAVTQLTTSNVPALLPQKESEQTEQENTSKEFKI